MKGLTGAGVPREAAVTAAATSAPTGPPPQDPSTGAKGSALVRLARHQDLKKLISSLDPNDDQGTGETADIKVLPLRMTAAEIEALDEAWRRLGFKSRTAMIRKAIDVLLA